MLLISDTFTISNFGNVLCGTMTGEHRKSLHKELIICSGIISILCEIKLRILCRRGESAIWTHLQALDFDFDEICHYLKAAIYQISKIQSP